VDGSAPGLRPDAAGETLAALIGVARVGPDEQVCRRSCLEQQLATRAPVRRVLHDAPMALYEVVIAIPAERTWCIEQQKRIRERLIDAQFDPTVLPSVRVEGQPAELVFRWTDMDFESGWHAVSVAKVAAMQVLPDLEGMPVFRVLVQVQDPDVERRRPAGT
jgi:hypothetical protein